MCCHHCHDFFVSLSFKFSFSFPLSHKCRHGKTVERTMLQHKFCKYTFCLFFLSVGRKNTMELNVYFLLSSQNKAQLRTNSQKQKYKIRNHKQQLFTFYLFPQIQAKQKRGRDKDRSSPASHLSDCCGGGK